MQSVACGWIATAAKHLQDNQQRLHEGYRAWNTEVITRAGRLVVKCDTMLTAAVFQFLRSL